MNFNDLINLDEKYYMNTFGKRTPVCFEYGKGIKLYSTCNDEYYDFYAGIATNLLGHSHLKFVEGLNLQLEKLIHTTNTYYIKNQTLLAEKLVNFSCFDKVFFCSTGAEANESAFKLAKIYFYKKNINKYEIISLKNSFHGRTLATVAATGQEKYQKPYRPLVQGFKHIEMNNIKELKNTITKNTAAIIIEPIQGESGVNFLDAGYIKEIRNICDKTGTILIFDEIQTGIGRTGKLFAYEHFNVEPDIITLAKGLGNGIPIGAVLAKNEIAKAFEPGDHGTTFGGNPFSCMAGLLTLDIMTEEGILENCRKTGEYFINALKAVKTDKIKEIRGLGLMIGVEFKEDIAQKVRGELFNNKILTGAVGTNILRLLPPLILNKSDVDFFMEHFKIVLEKT